MSNESPGGRPIPNWRRKPIRLQGFDYSDPNYVYSITLCACHLPQPYADPTLAGMVVASILFRAAEKHWRVYAYCLMPDHLHLALSPVVGKVSLPSLIQGFKSYTTRMAWNLGRRGILWQRSYYDHIARREEDVTAICQYTLANPVRKGLVSDPAKWAVVWNAASGIRAISRNVPPPIPLADRAVRRYVWITILECHIRRQDGVSCRPALWPDPRPLRQKILHPPIP